MSKLYVPLHVQYYADVKVLAAGEAAEILYVRSLALAKTLLTDGYLIRAQLRLLGLEDLDERIEALVREGLWVEKGDGWNIVSWLKYNQPKSKVDEISEKRSASGKLGGRPKQIANQSDEQNESAGLSACKTQREEKRREEKGEPATPSRATYRSENPHHDFITDLCKWFYRLDGKVKPDSLSSQNAIMNEVRLILMKDMTDAPEVNQARLRKILEFAVADDQFWASNVISLGELRKRQSKAAPMKWQNIEAQMKSGPDSGVDVDSLIESMT